jgi:outer membrane protein OmpA-like peptidoglycan-associated protein
MTASTTHAPRSPGEPISASPCAGGAARVAARASTRSASWLAAAAAVLAASGCATQDFVRNTVAPVESRVSSLATRTEGTEAAVRALDGRVKGTEDRLNALQANMQQTQADALARANAAGKLSEGRFLMQTVLTDDKIKFASGRAVLTAAAQGELNQLLAKLKADNAPVYLEIQGHTDTTGPTDLNQRLGLARADAVRQYLATQGMPLHRMATISYGEALPIADNRSAEGRSANRRVQLIVLR